MLLELQKSQIRNIFKVGWIRGPELGIVRDRTLMNMSPDEFDEVVAVNLLAASLSVGSVQVETMPAWHQRQNLLEVGAELFRPRRRRLQRRHPEQPRGS